ncbi:MAG: hypothetical protein HQL42_17645 [Alphaproteobacteria bacterium]|nr:hypothetical protein [Alphaproteobacteria bacterium]
MCALADAKYRKIAPTSHTYDETVALEVVKGIGGFLEEAESLLARLEDRLK